VGKYERDEVKPTIDVVKKLAGVLDTTVGYLLGETEDRELLKDPSMMKRLNDIAKFPEQDKHCILYALDAMINSVKLKAILCPAPALKQKHPLSIFCPFG
jgi:transcriptional regulator with XRE-family HTH domain